MREFKVISKKLNEKEFLDAIIEAQTKTNVSVLVENGCKIPGLRKAEIHTMGWKGLLTIKKFEDSAGNIQRIEVPENPEVVYIFSDDIKDVKVVKKVLKNEEEFMAAVREAKETTNATILIEAKKEIPFNNAQALMTSATGWGNVSAVTLFMDEDQEVYSFEIPEVPETMYIFDFE